MNEVIEKTYELLDYLTIFMESTGIYHLPVERYFKENKKISKRKKHYIKKRNI